MLANITQAFSEATRRFEAYWKNSNDLLFDMSLEALQAAWGYMAALTNEIADDKLLAKLSKRISFMFDMAAALGGCNG